MAHDRRPLNPADMDLEWLKAELAKPGRSQSALARFMKLDHPAIVNRIVNGTRQLKAHEADQIRAYLSVTANGVNGGNALYRTIDSSTELSARLVKVEGVVEAGAWREASASVPGPAEIPIVASMIEGDVFALRVAGRSMDEFYKDGSYVIVRRWAGGELPFGKHVVVQRVKPDGTHECTVKELREGADGPELWPRSTDVTFQKPVAYRTEDEITVEIIGRVVADLRFAA